jgi:hypothetical protein
MRKRLLISFLICWWASLPLPSLATTIEVGFDIFRTPGDGGTFVDLSDLGGPSEVILEGAPELLTPSPSGMKSFPAGTDTIVKRQQALELNQGEEGTTNIELVALSLKSVESLDISFLGFPTGTLADVYMTVNALGFANLPQPDSLTPSVGTMTIKHENALGGTFTSNLGVNADMILVIPGGNPNNPSDIIANMPAPVVSLDGKGEWGTQPVGFDKFKTKDGAYVDLSVVGGPEKVELEGAPELLQPVPQGLGFSIADKTDTIVMRKQDVIPEAGGGDVTVDIELVALALKSKEPLNVEFLGFPEGTFADLYATVDKLGFPNLPQADELTSSVGQMTIEGVGSFTSQLTVNADMILVKPGGDPNNPADWLIAPPIFPGHTLAPPVHLESTGTWQANGTAKKSKFVIIIIIHTAPKHIHKVIVIHRVSRRFIPMTIEHKGPHPVELSVSLASFEAQAQGKNVTVTWETGFEKNNAGFVVWRGEPVNGQCSNDPNNYINVMPVAPLVNSTSSEVSGATYEVKDPDLMPGRYCYALEDIGYNEVHTFHLDQVASVIVN